MRTRTWVVLGISVALLAALTARAGDGDIGAAVQEFEAEQRQKLGEAIGEVTQALGQYKQQMEELRNRIQNAEAGLRRLEALKKALDGGHATVSELQPTRAVEPGLALPSVPTDVPPTVIKGRRPASIIAPPEVIRSVSDVPEGDTERRLRIVEQKLDRLIDALESKRRERPDSEPVPGFRDEPGLQPTEPERPRSR